MSKNMRLYSFDASWRSSEDIGNVKRKVSTCREVMAQEINRVPVLICLNKINLATREHLEKVFEETRRVFEHEEIVEISSKTGSNVQELFIAERIPLDPCTMNTFQELECLNFILLCDSYQVGERGYVRHASPRSLRPTSCTTSKIRCHRLQCDRHL